MSNPPECPTHKRGMVDMGDKWSCQTRGCRIIKRKTKVITEEQHLAELKKRDAKIATLQAMLDTQDERESRRQKPFPAVAGSHIEESHPGRAGTTFRFYQTNHQHRPVVHAVSFDGATVDLTEFLSDVTVESDPFEITTFGSPVTRFTPGRRMVTLVLRVGM